MTLVYTDPCFARHKTPPGHPECPERMDAVATALGGLDGTPGIVRAAADVAPYETIARAHPSAFLERMEALEPDDGLVALDADTTMGPESWQIARRVTGAMVSAVDSVLAGKDTTAFVAARPPGHHAEKRRAMGFCLINHIAVAALHAMAEHRLERIAIIDFDVHHGNGTQDIMWDEAGVLYVSTHQSPHYPGTGAASERGGHSNVLNLPMPAGLSAEDYRTIFGGAVVPTVRAFQPELILLSAGFDAHAADPLGDFNLVEDDFVWITGEIMAVADEHAGGRVVSLLEGGYNLPALSRSVAAHVGRLTSS